MNKSIVLEKAIKFACGLSAFTNISWTIKRICDVEAVLLSGSYIAKHVKAALHSQAKSGFSSEMYKALEKGLETEL